MLAEQGELKPCPFCGGNGIHLSRTKSIHPDAFYIVCDNDSCMGTVGPQESQEKVTEAWNSRRACECQR